MKASARDKRTSAALTSRPPATPLSGRPNLHAPPRRAPAKTKLPTLDPPRRGAATTAVPPSSHSPRPRGDIPSIFSGTRLPYPCSRRASLSTAATAAGKMPLSARQPAATAAGRMPLSARQPATTSPSRRRATSKVTTQFFEYFCNWRSHDQAESERIRLNRLSEHYQSRYYQFLTTLYNQNLQNFIKAQPVFTYDLESLLFPHNQLQQLTAILSKSRPQCIALIDWDDTLWPREPALTMDPQQKITAIYQTLHDLKQANILPIICTARTKWLGDIYLSGYDTIYTGNMIPKAFILMYLKEKLSCNVVLIDDNRAETDLFWNQNSVIVVPSEKHGDHSWVSAQLRDHFKTFLSGPSPRPTFWC